MSPPRVQIILCPNLSTCGMCMLVYVTLRSEKGHSHWWCSLWACCTASSRSCGWDIKTVNFQKLETLRFLQKEVKIISQKAWTHVWEAKPPETVCLCPAHHPFHVSKASVNRQILEKSVKLFANMHWPV